MGYVWNMYGISMESVWNMYGICMECVWNMYGICMDMYGFVSQSESAPKASRAWKSPRLPYDGLTTLQLADPPKVPGYGICMECVWNMYGICMEYVWKMHGICMEYVWHMHGIATVTS